jgi:hypothetical protein
MQDHVYRIPRLRKRLLEADATMSARAGEIEIVSCATIAYSSENPAHPVEHMLDGHCGPGATRWISAGSDTVEQIVVEFDQPQPISRRLRSRGGGPRAHPGDPCRSLGGRWPNIPPNSFGGLLHARA